MIIHPHSSRLCIADVFSGICSLLLSSLLTPCPFFRDQILSISHRSCTTFPGYHLYGPYCRRFEQHSKTPKTFYGKHTSVHHTSVVANSDLRRMLKLTAFNNFHFDLLFAPLCPPTHAIISINTNHITLYLMPGLASYGFTGTQYCSASQSDG